MSMDEQAHIPDALDDRERLLIEAVVAMARTLRDERDRLAGRLRQVEQELGTLTERLEAASPDLPVD